MLALLFVDKESPETLKSARLRDARVKVKLILRAMLMKTTKLSTDSSPMYGDRFCAAGLVIEVLKVR